MKLQSLSTVLLLLLLLSMLLAAPATARTAKVTDPDAPRGLPVAGPVNVSWSDPSRFTELRYSRNRWQSERGNWVLQIARHLRERTERALPAGQRVEFNITDIKRAGDYEPWQGSNAQDVRIVRDVYPPRITFTMIRYGADGQVIEQGEHRLVGMGFLSRGGNTLDSDPLRHEKRMLDDWIRRRFQASGGTGLR